MEPRIVGHVERWASDGFDGGLDGLRSLVSDSFSGALVTDTLWMLLVNGKIVAVDGGSVADVNGNGSVYAAPDPALPLLFAMWGESEQVDRGFTDDESFDEVHQSLMEREFTGFLRLSEYVMSGDYFVVYYGGDAFPVAFVGSNERLHTGDRVLELAADEVGIFEVRRATVTVEPVPERP